jgi:hypothetical protein
MDPTIWIFNKFLFQKLYSTTFSPSWEFLKPEKQEKLKPGTSSPGAKQYGDGPTDGQTDEPMDEESYRGAMLALLKNDFQHSLFTLYLNKSSLSSPVITLLSILLSP